MVDLKLRIGDRDEALNVVDVERSTWDTVLTKSLSESRVQRHGIAAGQVRSGRFSVDVSARYVKEKKGTVFESCRRISAFKQS